VSGVDDTPARLVAAAESLFAEGGEEATSLRAVARAARANAAAVHYHFGGRDELLCAVLDRSLGPLLPRRLQLLERAVELHGDPVPVAAVVEAAVRPPVELLGQLRRHRVEVARFLGRAHSSGGPAVSAYLALQFERFAARAVPLLQRGLSEVDAGELRERLGLAVALTASLLATAPSPGQPGPLGTDNVDEQVRRLVAFCTAGMVAAPVPLAVRTVKTTRPGESRGSKKRKKRVNAVAGVG
jgi:AcrR family transcriptional regulator